MSDTGSEMMRGLLRACQSLHRRWRMESSRHDVTKHDLEEVRRAWHRDIAKGREAFKALGATRALLQDIADRWVTPTHHAPWCKAGPAGSLGNLAENCNCGALKMHQRIIDAIEGIK